MSAVESVDTQAGGAARRRVGWLSSATPPAALVDCLRAAHLVLDTSARRGSEPPARIAWLTRAPATASDRPDLTRCRVGVLHADAGAADGLAQALRGAGAQVALVSDSDQSLERLQMLEPDVLVVALGDLTGVSQGTLASVWSHPLLRWTPVLVCREELFGAGGIHAPELRHVAHGLAQVVRPAHQIARTVQGSQRLVFPLTRFGPVTPLSALVATGLGLRISLESSALRAEVDVAEGIVVGAQAGRRDEAMGALLGAPALGALLRATSGTLRVRKVEHPAQTNVMAPVDVAIVSALAEGVAAGPAHALPEPTEPANDFVAPRPKNPARPGAATVQGLAALPPQLRVPPPQGSRVEPGGERPEAVTVPVQAEHVLEVLTQPAEGRGSQRAMLFDEADTVPPPRMISVSPPAVVRHAAAVPAPTSVAPRAKAATSSSPPAWVYGLAASVVLAACGLAAWILAAPGQGVSASSPPARSVSETNTAAAGPARLPVTPVAEDEAEEPPVALVAEAEAPPVARVAEHEAEDSPVALEAEAPPEMEDADDSLEEDVDEGREEDEVEGLVSDDDVGADSEARLARAKQLVDEAHGLSKAERWSEARTHYLRALRLLPAYPRALSGLTQAHLGLRDYKAALRTAKRSVRLRPKRGSYRLLLGDAYAGLDKWELAKMSWRQASRRGSSGEARQRLRRAKAPSRRSRHR